MKKYLQILLIVVVLSGFTVPVQAQDWQRYSNDNFTFEYPEDWHVLQEQDGAIEISNMPIDPHRHIFSYESGQLLIAVSDLTIPGTLDDMPNLSGSGHEFVAGYLTGALWSISSFFEGFSAEESEIHEAETITIVGREATVARVDLSINDDGVEIMIIARSDDLVFAVQSNAGTLSDLEDDVMTIIESVERTGN